eukprot:GHVR01111763.1.p1 GENE.GHVR01111763.1~~GHVR01111763.1.p1  ORF type:complete len:147 (+),score=11.86 GHVR01111763.1:852-1292(+)
MISNNPSINKLNHNGSQIINNSNSIQFNANKPKQINSEVNILLNTSKTIPDWDYKAPLTNDLKHPINVIESHGINKINNSESEKKNVISFNQFQNKEHDSKYLVNLSINNHSNNVNLSKNVSMSNNNVNDASNGFNINTNYVRENT